MKPHAGVTQVFGTLLQVCSHISPLGLCLVNPFTAFRPRQVRRAYMPPTRAPTKAPTSVQPAFLKRFKVGQELAISAEGWEVLNGVGVDGVGVIFPFFYAFFPFPFFHAFFPFFFALPRQDSGGSDCPQKLPARVGPLSGSLARGRCRRGLPRLMEPLWQR